MKSLMAATKKKKAVESAAAKTPDRSTNIIYAVLFAIALFVIIAIIVSVRQNNDNDQITSWATKNSRGLSNFMQVCRQNSGDVDVMNQETPFITFVCTYPWGQQEQYQLSRD
jgi:hypothetical protein